jgi:hypothetical protein
MTTEAPVRTRKKPVKIEEVAETKVKEPLEEVVEEVTGPFEAFLEHQRKAFTEATKALESLVPEAFREHGQAAFKEVVEGYRQLFNTALDELEELIERAKRIPGRSEKVEEPVKEEAVPQP